MKYIIGVDIGGTNTDAVIVDENKKIIASAKTVTTKSIEEGFSTVLKKVLFGKKTYAEIEKIIVGTTHAVNAILEKKDLYKVGLIRIAGHFFESLPPCFEFEEDMKSILAGYETINGGNECDGRPISSFDEKQAMKAIDSLIKKGAESIAVVGVFSPIYNDMEKKLGELIKKFKGKDFPLSLSSEIGNIGFIERENSTILNSSLQKCLKLGFQNLKKVLKKMGIKAPLFLTQNNGSLLSLEKALRYPILTISSGPTNSFVGAAKLANMSNCIVVDIGGTSTDVGIVKDRYVRRSLNLKKIGNISLNFSTPDILSKPIGGGSRIQFDGTHIKIGPESIGKNLTKDSLCFKGNVLTLTDVAVALNGCFISKSVQVDYPKSKAKKVLKKAFLEIKNLIEEIKGKEIKLPIVIVGGAAKLMKSFFSDNKVTIPKYHDVANAYGASIAEVSATEDIIVSLLHREKALNRIKKKVIKKAISRKASPSTVRIVDFQIIPFHYMPNFLARVIVTAIGEVL
ncbi:MAG: hydantoinase/oxoprolinase family protein [Parachlamydiales bacterium]|nr:hydantoinase/oxoprolinase family protein [Parachlamydiales bacterium]